MNEQQVHFQGEAILQRLIGYNIRDVLIPQWRKKGVDPQPDPGIIHEFAAFSLCDDNHNCIFIQGVEHDLDDYEDFALEVVEDCVLKRWPGGPVYSWISIRSAIPLDDMLVRSVEFYSHHEPHVNPVTREKQPLPPDLLVFRFECNRAIGIFAPALPYCPDLIYDDAILQRLITENNVNRLTI